MTMSSELFSIKDSYPPGNDRDILNMESPRIAKMPLPLYLENTVAAVSDLCIRGVLGDGLGGGAATDLYTGMIGLNNMLYGRWD